MQPRYSGAHPDFSIQRSRNGSGCSTDEAATRERRNGFYNKNKGDAEAAGGSEGKEAPGLNAAVLRVQAGRQIRIREFLGDLNIWEGF